MQFLEAGILNYFLAVPSMLLNNIPTHTTVSASSQDIEALLSYTTFQLYTDPCKITMYLILGKSRNMICINKKKKWFL